MKLLTKSLSILAIGGIFVEPLLPDLVMPSLDSPQQALRKLTPRQKPNGETKTVFGPSVTELHSRRRP